MKAVLKTLAALAALGLAAAAAVIFLGLYNVSARSGHLPLVGWALHTTYDNAVELRAISEREVPPLGDPALIALGARHFDGACRICHSSPGERRSATIRSMTPVPPPIQDAIHGWEPRHLHWIVYQGVKMSGMPHWPAPRPEEVWPIVAFLDAVREMDAAGYEALVSPGGTAPTDPTLAYCVSCHGAQGRSELAPYVPRLDIQQAPYLALSLAAFRDGRRQSGIMEHAASDLDNDMIDALATHFAEQPPAPLPGRIDPDLARVGAAMASAAGGDPAVPACRACHGPDATQAAPGIPSLAGQHAAYLEAQLRLWRGGIRGGGPRANVMHEVADELTDDQIAALAAFYATLPPAKATTLAR